MRPERLLYLLYEPASVDSEELRDLTWDLKSPNPAQVLEILILSGIARVEVGTYHKKENVIRFHPQFCDRYWVEKKYRERHRGVIWQERDSTEAPLPLFVSAVKGLNYFFNTKNVPLRAWCTHSPVQVGKWKSAKRQLTHPCTIGLVDLTRPIVPKKAPEETAAEVVA